MNSIHKPKFLTGPVHRTDVMVEPVFNLVSSASNPHEVKKIDALRLKKIACYIHQYCNGDFEYVVRNSIASVDHLLDNNDFCDKSWYWVK